MTYTEEQIERIARTVDAEDAAQSGEPSPWDVPGDDLADFRVRRIAAFRAGLEAAGQPQQAEPWGYAVRDTDKQVWQVRFGCHETAANWHWKMTIPVYTAPPPSDRERRLEEALSRIVRHDEPPSTNWAATVAREALGGEL